MCVCVQAKMNRMSEVQKAADGRAAADARRAAAEMEVHAHTLTAVCTCVYVLLSYDCCPV